jgi:dipeptidyl aminopeptidase/acylaminoacyl peptidase
MKAHRAFLLAAIAGLAGLAMPPAQAADKHPFTADDWAKLRHAHVVAVSPDGATILYEVFFGGEKGMSGEEWRLINADGSNSRKLSLPEHFKAFGFTKDGAALYGSLEVEKMDQLATVPLAGGKATALTALKRGIHGATIAPDGSRYAVVADARDPDPLAEVHTVIENDETSLYVVNADGQGGGWWCGALKNVNEMAWSADGAAIAVMSQTPKIGYHYVQSFVDVCNGPTARRVAEIHNAASGIAWGSGGKELVFLSTTTDVLTPDHIWTVPAAGGEAKDRTSDLSGSAMNLVGDPHGLVWVEVHRGVQTEIDSFHDGILSRAYRWPGGYLELPVFPQMAAAPEQLAFSVTDPAHDENVAVPEGSELKKLTTEGDDVLAGVDMGPVIVVHWTNKEGIMLEGIATMPAGFTEGQRYPFLVFPHGGPEGNDVLSLGAWSRIISGMGYVVLQPEYRGSTGYGSDFLNAIYQHFGDRAYNDVDSATDFAITRGWADPKRLAIFGWSAGGFMTSWTVTQTGRYRAAIEGAGITDWLSFLWTSDVQQIDYDARWPEKDPTPFLKFSAIMYADRVTTPMLILHGGADVRVPTYQGREYFELLADHGKTVRMVTYPGSPHGPRLWEQRRDVFREIGAWLTRYNP